MEKQLKKSKAEKPNPETLGKGKYKILKQQADRFDIEDGYSSLSSVPSHLKLKRKIETENLVAKYKSKRQLGKDILHLPLPRQGKSLEELSGEYIVYKIKQFFVEDVGLPRLFDWLSGLSSIILGLSMFLYSKQTSTHSLLEFSSTLNLIKYSLILFGSGLIVSDMFQAKGRKDTILSNVFRSLLVICFAGLGILFLYTNDYDGFIIYGLFSLAILTEILFDSRSSTPYMLYTTTLLAAIGILLVYYPVDQSLAPISQALIYVLGGFRWMWLVLFGSLILVMLFGYLYNKKILKIHSAYVGTLLALLAFYFADNNHWERAFFILTTALIGIMLPRWESLKDKFISNRTAVYRMFGFILMFFVIMIGFVGFAQNTSTKNAIHALTQKSELGRSSVEKIVADSDSILKNVANSDLFQSAIASKDVETLNKLGEIIFNQIHFLGIVIIADDNGTVITSYPQAESIKGDDLFAKPFFVNSKKGEVYVSSNLEYLTEKADKVILIVNPIIKNGTFLGSVVSTLNLAYMGEELRRITTASQQITLVDSANQFIFPPQGITVGTIRNETHLDNSMFYTTDEVLSFTDSTSTSYDWEVRVSEPVDDALSTNRAGLIVFILLSIAIFAVMFTYVFTS